jgi:hypothetical protein
MATEQREKQAEARREREHLNDAVGRGVIHALGAPAGLHQTQVRWLWENCYRVNVFVGEGATCARIAHSFFLVTDGDGNILESTPRLTRRY